MSHEELHVVPLNDLKEHKISRFCSCNPMLDVNAAAPIWVHNSWDGREAFERETALTKGA